MPNIYRASCSEQKAIQKNSKNKKKKKSFKELKGNTVKSLNEVEYFLNNIKFYSKQIKIYKLLKNK